MHSAAVCQQEIRALGTIHTAAAAEPDDQIHIGRLGKRNTSVHISRCRILSDFIEHDGLQSGRRQRCNSTVTVSDFLQAGIRHQKNSSPRQFACQLSKLIEGPATINQSRALLEVKRTQRTVEFFTGRI